MASRGVRAWWRALWATPNAPGLGRVPVFVVALGVSLALAAAHSGWWLIAVVGVLGMVTGVSRAVPAVRESHV